jgi:hypothetical protein
MLQQIRTFFWRAKPYCNNRAKRAKHKVMLPKFFFLLSPSTSLEETFTTLLANLFAHSNIIRHWLHPPNGSPSPDYELRQATAPYDRCIASGCVSLYATMGHGLLQSKTTCRLMGDFYTFDMSCKLIYRAWASSAIMFSESPSNVQANMGKIQVVFFSHPYTRNSLLFSQ